MFMDFPQKLPPQYTDETQLQYFGKDHLNWSMSQFKKKDKDTAMLQVHSFPTIFDGKVHQDTNLILPMLKEQIKIYR